MNAQVARIQRKGGVVVQDCDVYIGRECKRGGWNLDQSKWHNPFPASKYGLDLCLELYERYVRSHSELMESLHELDGKVLGCWCKDNPDDKCHGDVLLKLRAEQLQ